MYPRRGVENKSTVTVTVTVTVKFLGTLNTIDE
jgi:hypothetical protein